MPEIEPLTVSDCSDARILGQQVKGESEVAGQATVCIFPDLNAGNNTYKVPCPAHSGTQSCLCKLTSAACLGKQMVVVSGACKLVSSAFCKLQGV